MLASTTMSGTDGIRHLDLPVLQHVEAHAVGGALVHVGVVFAGPGERLVFRAFHAFEADAAAFQHVEVLLREIMADDADERDRLAEKRSGQRGVGGGPAEQVRSFGFRSLDVIDGDGAADGDGAVVRGHGSGRSVRWDGSLQGMGEDARLEDARHKRRAGAGGGAGQIDQRRTRSAPPWGDVTGHLVPGIPLPHSKLHGSLRKHPPR
jgi:hypothetical protein